MLAGHPPIDDTDLANFDAYVSAAPYRYNPASPLEAISDQEMKQLFSKTLVTNELTNAALCASAQDLPEWALVLIIILGTVAFFGWAYNLHLNLKQSKEPPRVSRDLEHKAPV